MFDLITYYHERDNVNMDLITWGKTNPMPLSNNHFLNDTEYCLCIHEKGIGWNAKAGAKVKRKCYMTSVNKEDKNNFIHPCCKPVEILSNFVENSSKEGDIIFDPFMGSGSTCIAAKRLNRKYIGFELEEKWFNVAKDRLQGINQKGEVNLFDVDYE